MTIRHTALASVQSIILVTILVTGTMGFGISAPEAFADSAKGCEKAKEASNGKTNNPNCTDVTSSSSSSSSSSSTSTGDSDGDGIADEVDFCPNVPMVSIDDHDGDGVIDTADTYPCNSKRI